MKSRWAILLFLTLLIGCKSQHTIHEKVITKVDSTAIVKLTVDLQELKIENLELKTSLEKTKEENVKLSNEIQSHKIDYDTGGVVDKETGKYPIASETITSSKSVLEKAIMEKELLIQEYRNEVSILQQKNSNLNYQIQSIKDENRNVKSKVTKEGFSITWFLVGGACGFIFLLILVIYLKSIRL